MARSTRRPASVALAGLSALALGGTLAVSAPAQAAPRSAPDTIVLPDGFQPEGIASVGPTAYVGSLNGGDILRLDLRTGATSRLAEGDGTPSVGLAVSGRRLFVAGDGDGDLTVLDRRTGRTLATYQLASGGTFINDVIVTDEAAYVTDSQAARLFVVPFEADGSLPGADAVQTLPLTGEWEQVGNGFNANGIETTPDGEALLVVNSTTGRLYRVEPATGEATVVDLGGADLSRGDGLLRQGRTLYVVKNQDNQVAVLRLDTAGTTGRRTATITSDRFDVPTTVARWGRSLYLPNARFGSTGDVDPADASYEVNRVPARR